MSPLKRVGEGLCVDVNGLIPRIAALKEHVGAAAAGVPPIARDQEDGVTGGRVATQRRLDFTGPAAQAAAVAPNPHEAEFEDLRTRLRNTEVELAAQRFHSTAGTPAQLTEILDKQTQLLERALDKPRVASSTIKVEPKVFWPKLGDDGPGGKEVEEFYEKFEEICSLANDGTGMSDKEMLVALKTA